MQKVASLLLVLLSLVACKGSQYDFEDSATPSRPFFSLLDDYPALKDAFSPLNATTLNDKLAADLTSQKENAVKFLIPTGRVFYNQTRIFQRLMDKLRQVLSAMLATPETSFSHLENMRQRMNGVSGSLTADSLILLGTLINGVSGNIPQDRIESLMGELVGYLQEVNTQDRMVELESFLIKLLEQNGNTGASLTKLVSGLSRLHTDPVMRDAFVEVISEFSSLFDERTTGYSLGSVLENLGKDLGSQFTSQGVAFSQHGSRSLGRILFNPNSGENYLADRGAFTLFRDLVSGAAMSDRKTGILQLMADGLRKIDYEPAPGSIEAGLEKFIAYDADLGLRDAASNQNVSILETILFASTISANFGFGYSDWGIKDSNNGQNGQRVLSMGDVFNAMGISPVFQNTFEETNGSCGSSGDSICRDGQVVVWNTATAALTFLEGESRGDFSLSSGVHAEKATTLWVLNWLAKVVWKGYGPYYNPARVSAMGVPIVPDGSEYFNAGVPRNYRQNWTTSYWCIENTALGLVGSNNCRSVGASTNRGERFSISEIYPATTCVSDEDCLYKNFQWLLYEKRFVITIPINLVGAGAFVTVIANGLMGVLNARPYDGRAVNNGKWILAGTYLKGASEGTGLSLTLSDQPGDAVVHFEPFTNALSAGTTFRTTAASAIYLNIADDSPKRAIPDIVAINAQAIRHLGLVSNTPLASSMVSQNWDKRSHLLPLLAAFIGEAYEKSDNNTGSGRSNVYDALIEFFEVIQGARFTKGSTGFLAFDTLVPRIESTDAQAWVKNLGTSDWNAQNFRAYGPSVSLSTPLSRIIEQTPGSVDGILRVLTKTKAMSTMVRSLKLAHSRGLSAVQTEVLDAVATLVGEMRLNSEVNDASHFSFEDFVGNAASANCQVTTPVKSNGIECDLAIFAAKTNHQNFRDLMTVLSASLPTWKSGLPRQSVANLLQQLSVGVSYDEAEALKQVVLNILGSGTPRNPRKLISGLLTGEIPQLFQEYTGQHSASLMLQANLLSPEGTIPYFTRSLRSSYPLRQILNESANFLGSPTMQDVSFGSLSQQLSQFSLEFAAVLGSRSSAGALRYFEDTKLRDSKSIQVLRALENIHVR